MKNMLILLMVTLLGGCVTQSTRSTNNTIKPATSDDVKNCEYIDHLIGTSALYGAFATQGIKNARAEVFENAANIGATHIAWLSSTVVYGSTSVAGSAYRCNK